MKEIAELLNQMCQQGIIKTYAVFGAVAQMRYTEAVVTMDMDILIELDETGLLVLLTPIYEFCRQQGYEPEGEAIRVGDWPVQFIPTFDELSANAVREADCVDLDGVAVRVVTAVYLATMALQTGRAKDHIRILALLECEAVTMDDVEKMVATYNLAEAWHTFRRRFVDGESRH